MKNFQQITKFMNLIWILSIRYPLKRFITQKNHQNIEKTPQNSFKYQQEKSEP